MAKITTALFGDLAFIPNIAEVPVTESLAFLTDNIESWNGTEQAIELRTKARQSFTYSVPFRLNSNPDIFNTAWGAIRKKWAVPQWTDLQYVGNVATGAAFVTCNTTDYDLRASSLAFLVDGCGNYRILEITTITGTQINLSTTLAAAINGAYLVPIRIGYISGAINRPFGGYFGKVEFNFEVDIADLKEFTPAAPTQYLASDIYFTPGLIESNMRESNIIKREDIVDFDLGYVERRSPWTRAKFGQNFRSLTGTPAERTEFRNFIYRRYGKSRQFWMPTFENNLRCLNTGNVVSTLVVSADSYIAYAADRVHIAIEAGGVWYPRVISAPTPTGPDTMQLTLSSALNVPASSINRISYLGLNRLDSDSVDFNYNTSQTVECNVRIVELTP